MKKFYITTAIDYVNAPPHIGHAYEKICADMIARWHRMKGEEVYFLTGTDENAQKNAQAAKKTSMNTMQFVDENSKKFIDLCAKLNISNNDFIRTTEERHIRVVQEVFKKIFDKGDIYKGFYEGYYCDGCEAFVTKKELEGGRCPEHDIEPHLVKEESYFFKLSRYQNDLLRLLENDFVEPQTRKNEIANRLKEGLNDLSVSRENMDWGIPVPGDEMHKIYVWFDALVNYISALGYPDGELFKKYWPADIHLIGKGINWFHSVIWPAILISAEIELPKKIFVHGYVNVKGQKISKSLGNVIDPICLIGDYGMDALRYFLIREVPFGEDGDFSVEALERRFNSDLANDLGNLLNRTLTMLEKYFAGYLPYADMKSLAEIENLKQKALDTTRQVTEKLNVLDINSALISIWELINTTNKFIEDTKPWILAKENPEALKAVMVGLFETLKLVSLLIWPFMPKTSVEMRRQMGLKTEIAGDIFGELKWGKSSGEKIKITKGSPLFPRIK